MYRLRRSRGEPLGLLLRSLGYSSLDLLYLGEPPEVLLLRSAGEGDLFFFRSGDDSEFDSDSDSECTDDLCRYLRLFVLEDFSTTAGDFSFSFSSSFDSGLGDGEGDNDGCLTGESSSFAFLNSER